MTQYFYNREPIDRAAIELLGVSVKSSGSIGFFGTGLKFALAVLLRNGCEVTLVREGRPLAFGVREARIRGQGFEQVTFDGQPLGFTTDLGRNWLPWMAFRELHANALDEGGGSGEVVPTPVEQWGTIFAVEGEAIEAAARDRDEIFLPTAALQPRLAGPEVAIYPKRGSGRDVYYRTIRAREIELPTLFSYNILQESELTEDRTLKYEYMVTGPIQRAVQASVDRELIELMVLAPEGIFEHALQFNSVWATSSEFLEVCAQHRRNHRLNESAYRTWCSLAPLDAAEPEEDLELTAFQAESLRQALEVLGVLGYPSEGRASFRVVTGLGEGVMGRYANGQIHIARGVFDQGPLMIAGTLWEELLHKYEFLGDESRTMQNFLINRACALAAELSAAQRMKPQEVIRLAVPVVDPHFYSPGVDDEIPF